jgi:hypothetical protein
LRYRLAVKNRQAKESPMFGKKLSEYVYFVRWILILVAVAFVIRLGISIAGTPFTETRWFSINLVLLVGLIYCSIAVHTSGFGSYKRLFGLLLVQNVFAHTFIALRIAIAIVTGKENAFTVPEVSGGGNGASWFHALIHLVVGFIVPVFAWIIGSAILFVTKKLSRA